MGGNIYCKHCGVTMDWLNKPLPSGQLDFSDGRVIMQLIEKVGDVWVTIYGDKTRACVCSTHEALKETPQEAICLAIDAWLKEEGQ